MIVQRIVWEVLDCKHCHLVYIKDQCDLFLLQFFSFSIDRSHVVARNLNPEYNKSRSSPQVKYSTFTEEKGVPGNFRHLGTK